MKRLFYSLILCVLLGTMMLAASASAAAPSSPIYDATPDPLPYNLASLGYQATATAEFGDHIAFSGTDRNLTTVVVTMSNWALNSTYPDMDAVGFVHPITLTIYEADTSGSLPVVGPLIATATESFLIPWRPEADATCPGGTAWRAADNACYNGLAFNITFDLTSQGITLPGEVIYGIAYNTNTWGYEPIGEPGPYESLNVGLADVSPTVGSDVDADALFWNTAHAGFYTDGGAAGVGVFRQDTNWSPYTPAVQFNAAPPLIGPPTSKDECKNGGWQTFNNPTYKNQGNCVSFVASKGKSGGTK